MRKVFLLLSALALAGFSASALAANLESVISNARATVAPEAELDKVSTLTFEAEAFDADGKKSYDIFLQFKRPYCVHEVVRKTEVVPVDEFYYPEEQKTPEPPKVYEVEVETICNGDEGVRIIRNLTTKARQIDVLSAAEVLMRRDFAGANLDFYKPLAAADGTTVFKGEEVDNGKKVNVVEYNYKGGLKIERAFDAETGALFSTKINDEKTYDIGEKIRTGGLTFLDGSRSVDAAGKTKSVFKFKKILVNEEIPDSVFKISLQNLLIEEE